MKGRCQKYQRGVLNSIRAFLFFSLKNISSISQFLEVAEVKGRYHRYQRGALKSMRAFLFFSPKHFSLISRFIEVAQMKGVIGTNAVS